MTQQYKLRCNAARSSAGRGKRHACLYYLRQGRGHNRRMGCTNAQCPWGISRPDWGIQINQQQDRGLDDIRAAVDVVSDKLGHRLRFLVGKPGLDGHSNGAEQIAFRARDCGMEIDYEAFA